jgi:hypothetical protein
MEFPLMEIIIHGNQVGMSWKNIDFLHHAQIV